jgi:hypothetical protein
MPRRSLPPLLALTFALTLAPAGARAATLVVSGGQLLGATGVDVGGNLFDVAFVDGTCIALFDGCDDASDFTFTSEADGVAASQALLDQVFVDGGAGAFDTEPELTAGCSQTFACSAQTPYDAFASTTPGAFSASVVNYSPPNTDYVSSSGTTFGTQDLTGATGNVWAVWTASVPEPGAGLLVGAGLLALAARQRRAR